MKPTAKHTTAFAKPQAAILANLLLLLLMSTVIVLERWHTFDEPLDRDIAGYAVLSHEMLGGRKLYSDLWERKPPLLFAAFAAAEKITGYGRGEIFLLDVTVAIATMYCVYLSGGIFAAVLWMLLGGDMWVQGNQPNAEVFVNLCLAAGFAILLREGLSHRRWRAVGAGLMLAAATLFKHHVIVICAALLAADLFRKRRDPSDTLGSRFFDASVAGSVIVGAWLMVFGYFLHVGRFADFYSALFRQNAAYAGSLTGNLVGSFSARHLFDRSMCWALVPVALVILWLISGAKNRESRPWRLVCCYAVSAWIAVALPGYFWGHYYQLLLPPFCIAGGWATAGLVSPNQRWPASVRYLCVGAIFTFRVCWEASNYRLSAEQWARDKYTTDDVTEQQSLGRQLRKILLPGEQVWELGEDNEIYFESGKSPPSGLIYLEPISSGPERSKYTARVLADLKRTRPDLVILDRRWIESFPPDSEILPWIRSEYVPDGGKLDQSFYLMYVRRGSALARRLQIPF